MRKAIFTFEKITPEKLDQIKEIGTSDIFVGQQNLAESDIDEAKKRGFQIYVEIGIFVGQDLWQKYPDSRPIDVNGKPINPEGWYYGVCPNHLQVRREKLARIKEILLDYDIDGLWLDFIRYPGHWEVPNPKIPETCFCQNCLTKFSQDSGIQLSRDFSLIVPCIRANLEVWREWRERQITEFVQVVAEEVNKLDRKVELGIFVVPQEDVAKAVGQNRQELASVVNTVTSMTYHAMCGKKPEWINETVNNLSKFTKSVLSIVQTENKPRKVSTEEFCLSLEEALKPPSTGVIIFFLEDLLKDQEKTEIVKRVFRN